MRRVRQAADALKARFGVRRVVLFGSLAHEAWFVPDSDVDLAVMGLRTEDYWRAWRLAEDIIADRPVDLIDVETAVDSLRRAIERHGVEL
jgi:predicted nucleotidyltransferase